MNQLRKDYLLDRWVIIAEERNKRPWDFIKTKKIKTKTKENCFFCPGNEHKTPPEIDRTEENGEWIIRCFPNKYPATTNQEGPQENNLLTKKPAYGRHEVIAETPDHSKELGDLSTRHIEKILDMYIKRLTQLKKDKKIRYVSIFKNRGETAGASLEHSHTQVIAIPITPPTIEKELREIKRYRQEKERCILCDVWRNELKSERKIIEDKHTAAFTPYASTTPFHTWIMPKRHIHTLEELRTQEKKSFAKTLKKILSTLNKTLNYPPYNLYFQLSPDKEDYHMHMEILPKLSTWAGFELGNNIIINTLPPETAAKHYRNKIQDP